MNIGRWVLTNLLLAYTYKVHAVKEGRKDVVLPPVFCVGSPAEIGLASPLVKTESSTESSKVVKLEREGSDGPDMDSQAFEALPEIPKSKANEALAEIQKSSTEAPPEDVSSSAYSEPDADKLIADLAVPDRSTTPNSFMGKLKGHMKIKSGTGRKWNGKKKNEGSDDEIEDRTVGWPEENVVRGDHPGKSLEKLDKEGDSSGDQHNAIKVCGGV